MNAQLEIDLLPDLSRVMWGRGQNMGRFVKRASKFPRTSLETFQLLISVYSPAPAVPEIAILPPGPPISVEQNEVAVVELDQSAVQDDSTYDHAGSDVENEPPRIHPDVRQANVVNRMHGPADPYVALSDDSEDEGNPFRSIFHF